MVDGRGKITRYSYGPAKIVKTVIDADGKEISYRYNLNGNVAEMLDRNGNTTEYIYDNRNLLVQKRVRETGDSISYSYDAAGNRASMKDGSGETTYTYDKNNKVTEIVKDGAAQISYTYDSVGNVDTVSDYKGFITKYSYDKSNRMQTVTFSGNTTTYSYDKNGNRESVEYGGGVKEAYTYDKNNRLLTLTNKKPDGSEISKYSYTYYENGLQKTKTDSYGTTQYDYDAAGRVQKVTTPGKTTVYAYDKAGNRLSQNETYTSAQPTGTIDEATGKEVQYIIKKSEYVYSNTSQLVRLTEKMLDTDSKELLKKETDYYFDANGNQLNQNSSLTAPNSIKKRQSTKGSAQGDDADETISSLIERSSNTFDGFNRLKKVESVKDGVRTLAEYTYNGDDLRVRKSVKSSEDGYTEKVTSYLYDRQYVILETDGANAVKARYIKGVNYIAKLDSSEKLSYFMYNGHGDVVQTVTAAGKVMNQYDYDIWGNATLTVETEECSIRYSGEYLDSESGLYYLRGRFYDPHLGRFMSQDTFKGNDLDPLSLNLYTYCANNPIKYVDPSGHTYFQYGDTGDGVKQVQQKLIDVGLLDKGDDDGIFGDKTLAAIKSFQECWGFTQEGQEADGIVGNQTFQGLMSYAEHYGEDGDSVYNMMDNIKNNTAPAEIPGYYTIGSEETQQQNDETVYNMRGDDPNNVTLHTSVEDGSLHVDSAEVKDPNTGESTTVNFETPVDVKNQDQVDAAKNQIADVQDQQQQEVQTNAVVNNEGMSNPRVTTITETQSFGKVFVTKFLDNLQNDLDSAGLVPGYGEPFDALNAIIYNLRGDKTNAAISIAGLAVGGQAATGARIIKNTEKALDAAKTVEKSVEVEKTAEKTLEAATGVLDDGLGTYAGQAGHHPMAKSAFEGISQYDFKQALTISQSKLTEFGVKHATITGQQKAIYSAFEKTGEQLTMDVMREIEIKAMTNSGVPLDYATNAVDKAIEALNKSGVTNPSRIPWTK